LSRIKREHDFIMIVANQFYEIAHFIPGYKNDDASYIAYLYFKEVIKLQWILRCIVVDEDTEFLSHF